MSKGIPKETIPEGFTEETKAPPIGFVDVHPGPNAGGTFKGKDSVPWAGSDGLESEYFRCKQCGFVNNRKRNTPGSGWGNDTNSAITTLAGGTAVARDPDSSAGCPLCNSSAAEAE